MNSKGQRSQQQLYTLVLTYAPGSAILFSLELIDIQLPVERLVFCLPSEIDLHYGTRKDVRLENGKGSAICIP
jgi:hypothetical protein